MATATAHAVHTRTEILAPTADFRSRRFGSTAPSSPGADSIFNTSADAKRVSFGSSSSSSSSASTGCSRGFGGFREGRAGSSASSASFEAWADDFDALDGEFDFFADYDLVSDLSVDAQLSDDDGVPASSSASLASSASAASDEASLTSSQGQGALPDSTTMNLLHCLFALAFAAFTLGVLTFTGVVVRTSGSSCPATMGYSWCAVIQDLRSILSFVLGALLCWLFTRGKDGPESEAAAALGGGGAVSGGGWMGRVDKVQLYAYML